MLGSDPFSRYTTPEMGAIWSDAHRFALMARIAALAAQARGGSAAEAARLGRVARRLDSPAEAARFADAVRAAESRTRHETAALLEVLGRRARAARALHAGLTSSDLLDTALAVQMRAAAGVLCAAFDELLRVVARLARTHAHTVMIGRTHGMQAEPITFGLKAAGWHVSVRRVREALAAARETVSIGKLSGAVGTYVHVSSAAEARVCRRLGLRPAVAATQVVPREVHAILVTRCALAAAVLEKIATEIRHLQRTEVREVEEPFASGQVGSTAMPHKRNPVRCERVCGQARLVRGFSSAALENVALWHERDMSHSSVERVALPGATGLLHFMLREMTDVLRRLRIYPARMRHNLEASGGLVYSERVMLALVEVGLPRPRAYALVQRLAARAWEGGTSFRELVAAAPEIRRRFRPAQVAAWFDPRLALRHVDVILRRAGLR